MPFLIFFSLELSGCILPASVSSLLYSLLPLLRFVEIHETIAKKAEER
jgi:hypothetical protein